MDCYGCINAWLSTIRNGCISACIGMDGHGIAELRPYLADGQVFVDSCSCLPQVPGPRFLEFASASLGLQLACFLMHVLSGSLAAQVYRQSRPPLFVFLVPFFGSRPLGFSLGAEVPQRASEIDKSAPPNRPQDVPKNVQEEFL